MKWEGKRACSLGTELIAGLHRDWRLGGQLLIITILFRTVDYGGKVPTPEYLKSYSIRLVSGIQTLIHITICAARTWVGYRLSPGTSGGVLCRL